MTADTLPKVLLENARRWGEKVALREKEYGIWQSLSWARYLERVQDFSLGLLSLGLSRGGKVAIVGDNRPEWVIAELATQAAGGISMGVYQDSVAAELQFLVAFSQAEIVVAENQEQVDKVLEVWDELPAVKNVIYYDPRGLSHYDQPFLHDFVSIEARGRELAQGNPALFEENVARTRGEDVAILSTTSGTTGKPKLAMLTHQNLLSMARNFLQVDPLKPEDEFLSFLPMAWIGEQMLTIALGLLVGFAVNFPEEPETVELDLREIGPHMIFSPPRIWENMVSDVQVRIEDSSWLKRRVYDWAVDVGYRAADSRLRRGSLPWTLALKSSLAHWLCLVWIRDKLGLRRVRRAYTGGAALGPDIFRFYHALGVNLKQIYGQTEVSGISVLHRDDDIRFQSVGVPLPGTEIRLTDRGEILTRGPAVFVGYYENPEATAETLQDGWLHSGDAGYFDDEGHLVVVDRARDVMTLEDGTRFSPQFIENKLKFSPYIREAVVFGGDWPFVSAMITIDYPNTGKWAERRQIPYTTFTDLAQKGPVYDLVREHVLRTNEDLPPAARVRRFLLLHKELDADDEELTRTRKVRRGFVAQRYEDLVTALYSEAQRVAVETEITYQDGRTAKIRTELGIETLEREGTGLVEPNASRPSRPVAGAP